ncbi:MAG: hypothetical protein FJ304_14425 [Planctomycetes bacterium]|nr:hypothetical protein [Planctomycetota bacterium]
MIVRLLAVLIAFVVAPLSVRGADEEHPLKKSKVGDFATYKRVFKFDFSNREDSITYMVVLNCDKEKAVVLKATGKNQAETLQKIDLSKAFDPTRLSGSTSEGQEVVKSEKVEGSKEKIKVGDSEYDCTRTTSKLKTKITGTDIELDVEVKQRSARGLEGSVFCV